MSNHNGVSVHIAWNVTYLYHVHILLVSCHMGHVICVSLFHYISKTVHIYITATYIEFDWFLVLDARNTLYAYPWQTMYTLLMVTIHR